MSGGEAAVKVRVGERVSGSDEGGASIEENCTGCPFVGQRGLTVAPLVGHQRGCRWQLWQEAIEGVQQRLLHLLLRLVQVLLGKRDVGLHTDGGWRGWVASTDRVNGDVANDRVVRKVLCSPADAQRLCHGNVKEDAQAEHAVILHSLELVQGVPGDNVKEVSLNEPFWARWSCQELGHRHRGDHGIKLLLPPPTLGQPMPICEWTVPVHMVQLLQGTRHFQFYARVVPVVMYNCLEYGMSLCLNGF